MTAPDGLIYMSFDDQLFISDNIADISVSLERLIEVYTASEVFVHPILAALALRHMLAYFERYNVTQTAQCTVWDTDEDGLSQIRTLSATIMTLKV